MQSTSKHTISDDLYRNEVWPQLSGIILQLLSQSRPSYNQPHQGFIHNQSPLSFNSEDCYRTVYNCCCQGLSARLYKDLCALFEDYLVGTVVPTLGRENDVRFVPSLAEFYKRFRETVDVISPVFGYLVRL